MLPGFHILELIIVLIIACLIFRPRKFLALSLKVSLRIMLFLAALIFGRRLTIPTFREVLQDFLKRLERLEQEKLTIPTSAQDSATLFCSRWLSGLVAFAKVCREGLRNFLKRWKRRL